MERNFLETNYLYLAFVYDYTKEGYNFWDDVDSGKRPPIPQSLLDELSEWQKGKEPKGIDLKAMEQKIDKLLEGETEESMTDWLMNKRYNSPDHRLFTAAVAAMQGLLSNTSRPNFKDVPKIAVKQAQALLAELDKTK
jgi:hypothetical protein